MNEHIIFNTKNKTIEFHGLRLSFQYARDLLFGLQNVFKSIDNEKPVPQDKATVLFMVTDVEGDSWGLEFENDQSVDMLEQELKDAVNSLISKIRDGIIKI